MDKKSEVGSLPAEVMAATAMPDKTVALLLVCSFVCIEQQLVASVAALATILFAPVLRDWAAKK